VLASALLGIARISPMAMTNDATPKPGGSGGGELEKRVTAVEARLGVLEKAMTAEIPQREPGALRRAIGGSRADLLIEPGALRGDMREIVALHVEIAKVPFRAATWVLAVISIGSAIATTIYHYWFR
jgi:hypothetical protein